RGSDRRRGGRGIRRVARPSPIQSWRDDGLQWRFRPNHPADGATAARRGMARDRVAARDSRSDGGAFWRDPTDNRARSPLWLLSGWRYPPGAGTATTLAERG